MIKTRGKNRKPTKNVNLAHEQDSDPAKPTGELAEPPEELTELTGDRVKVKPATQPSQEGEETQQLTKNMADLETILQ